MRISQRFNRFLTKRFSNLTEKNDLSMRDIRVLLFLINNPTADTARDITELRGIPKSQVSAATELLCSRGLLLRRADSDDRRIIHLSLTESGREIAAEAQKTQSDCISLLFDGFSPAEERQFHSFFERVLENGSRFTESDDICRL